MKMCPSGLMVSEEDCDMCGQCRDYKPQHKKQDVNLQITKIKKHKSNFNDLDIYESSKNIKDIDENMFDMMMAAKQQINLRKCMVETSVSLE